MSGCRQFVLILAAVIALGSAWAGPLVLKCEGVLPTYPNGFGGALPEKQSVTTRIVELDLEANKASTISLFGAKTGQLGKSSDNFYSFVLRHDSVYKGKLVVSEHVSINRYTGEIYAYYVLDSQPVGTMGYSAFSGTCIKAERLF